MREDGKLREAYVHLKLLLEEVQRHKMSGRIGVEIECDRGEPKQVRRLMNVV